MASSLKDAHLKPIKEVAVQWPRQLRTPVELLDSLRHRTQTHLIRSPIYSKIILQFVGSWAYLLAHVLNRTQVFNAQVFEEELRRIERQTELQSQWAQQKQLQQQQPAIISSHNQAPLLTLSNHISCIDDPVLWASLLPLTYYSARTDSVRWAAAAVEICFSKPWHSAFFSLGKTFPIVRGAGLHQPGMDFASALLRYNQWLHLFPEGKVMRDEHQKIITNKQRGYIFKWGVSKLILDYFAASGPKNASEKRIRILPFYHLGLDEILPIGWPYIPRFGKQITIFIRPKVIELDSKLLEEILRDRSPIYQSSSKSLSNDDVNRIRLTSYLEDEVERLIEPASRMHGINS